MKIVIFGSLNTFLSFCHLSDKFNFDTVLDHFEIWKIRGIAFLKRQIDTKYKLKYV